MSFLLGAATTVAVSAALAWRVDTRAAPMRSAFIDFADGWVTDRTKGWRVDWRTRPGAVRGVIYPGHHEASDSRAALRLVGRIPWASRAMRTSRVMDAVRQSGQAPYTFDLRGWPALAMACSWANDEDTPDPLFVRLARLELGPYPPTTVPAPFPQAIGSPFRLGALPDGFVPVTPPPPPAPVATPRDNRAIPLFPVWPGFGVNALFYGALWAIPLMLVPALRRAVRRHRRRCAECNYDLAGLPPSTPCPECGRKAVA